MSTKGKEVLFALIMGLVLPGILLQAVRPEPAHTEQGTENNETQQSKPDAVGVFPVLMSDGTVVHMELDDYVTGVVLAEMPAEFDPEALKAQAVAARTYALKRFQSGEKHEQGAVCTNSACCQSYCSRSDFLKQGESEASLQKVISAVKETQHEVLLYDGKLIEATYFSCSGGKTEDAMAVWGAEIPYLRPVESPGEEQATYYTNTVAFELKEFAARMELDYGKLYGNWIGTITYTPGGGVDTMNIAGQSYKGITVRQKLDLRSTAFVITAVGNTVTITTKGFGHRVGMSQYGAEAMAVSGSTYDEILAHYYQGAQLRTLNT